MNYFDVHCSLAQNEETPQAVSRTSGSRNLETSGLQMLALSATDALKIMLKIISHPRKFDAQRGMS